MEIEKKNIEYTITIKMYQNAQDVAEEVVLG